MARTREPGRGVAPERDRPEDVHGPVRTCIGCRSRASASELLRVVAAGGIVDPDPRHRKPGRGAWVHPDPDCLHRAERRSAFPRALRVPGPLDTGALHALLAPAGTPPTGHDRRDDRRVRTRKQVDPHEPAVKPSR
ncbi:YlxR family protein [Actinomycetospora rhizophila]|uniref:YlxR family protein n=1 Tax=Actinomycetospora rhizophila TaxID=1416876 RepID=A0ABV9ZJK8_9PSEU